MRRATPDVSISTCPKHANCIEGTGLSKTHPQGRVFSMPSHGSTAFPPRDGPLAGMEEAERAWQLVAFFCLRLFEADP